MDIEKKQIKQTDGKLNKISEMKNRFMQRDYETKWRKVCRKKW